MLRARIGGILHAYVADVTTPENRDVVYGTYYTLSYTVGSLTPIAVGYLADSFGFSTGFLFVALVSVLAVAIIHFMR